MGTTGYGAPLHYDYYKKSFSHNTICINGKNQPPINPVIKYYNDNNGSVQIIVEVDWKNPPVLPDSNTRIEWDNEV
ncbi:heparinase II/III-family protein, partial [Citrobacter portucalensis]|nr:heparinase II/III-family protein [Citrobacter portucalensis]